MSRIWHAVFFAMAIFSASAWGADAETVNLAPGQGGQAENRILAEKIKQGDRMALLARDLGGLAQLTKFLTQPDKEAVARTLTSYGMNVVIRNKPPLANNGQHLEGAVAPQASPMISGLDYGALPDCVMYYPMVMYNISYIIGQSICLRHLEYRGGTVSNRALTADETTSANNWFIGYR